MLDSKKIGNQERRLNDLLEQLLDKPEEHSGHIADIRSHQSLLHLSKETAIKMLPGLSPEQFRNNMAKLKAAGVILSAEYKSAVFSKCVNNQLSNAEVHNERNLETVLKHLELHKDTKTEFDPTFPMLSALDQSLSHKFKNFQKVVMERVFTTTVGKGAVGAPIVTKLSAKLLESFENMPPELDLPVSSNAIVMDCITIWRCIVAVESESLDGTTNGEDMESFTNAVEAVHEASQVEGSRNIKAIIGRLLMTNSYWAEKVSGFVDTRAALRDLAPKVRATVQVLEGAVPGNSDTTEHLSRASDLHLLAAERLRTSAYASLSKQLLKSTDDHIAATLGSPSNANMQAVSAALQSVSLALPNEPVISSLCAKVAEQLRKTAAQSKTTTLQAEAVRIVEMQSKQLEESAHSVCKDLESCQGVDPSAKPAFDACEKAYSHVTSFLVNGFDEDSNFGGEGARVVAEAISGFIMDAPHVKTVLDCFGQVRNMFLLMKEKKAIIANKFSFGDAQVEPDIFATFQGYLAKSRGIFEAIEANGYHSEDLAAPLCDFCASKIKECGLINSTGIDAYRKKQEAALDKAQQALAPLLNPGPTSGLSWQDNLGEKPSWDEFEAACKQHLLQNEYAGQQLPQLRSAVLKDRAIGLAYKAL